MDQEPNNRDTNCFEEIAVKGSGNLTDKQKTRLKYLSERAGVTFEEAVEKKMSQRKLKKMASAKKYAVILKSKRKEEKDKRKKYRLEKKQKGELLPKIKKSHVLMKDSPNQVKVAIDLNFNDLMNDKDIKKLRKQVLRCYSANRASSEPLQLYLTSCTCEVQSIFTEMKCGFTNWDVNVRSEDHISAFSQEYSDKKNIVYLTRDSENVLPPAEEIKATAGKKVYIIGGLVDHNTHKGLTLKIANEQGISHARFPIDEYDIKMCKTQVLTVNHVFEIMLLVSQGTSWSQALQTVIPQRKLHPSSKPTNNDPTVNSSGNKADEVRDDKNSSDSDDEANE
jgi:tRNA (guanine9-N1)-methyltransferase